MRAWWEHELLDRCVLWVTAPKDGAQDETPPTRPDTPEERWLNLDYVSALNDFLHRTTYWGGDAYPRWIPGTAGHTGLSTLLGSPIRLDMRTGWHEAILTGEGWSTSDLVIDYESKWAMFAFKVHRRAVEESTGKSIPAINPIGGTGDTLVSLRGNDRLLFDVLEQPDLVRETELHLMDLWIAYYKKIYDVVAPASDGGISTWFPPWAPGKVYVLQNDFSCMISTEMFEGMFIPALEKQMSFLDYGIYHVDGVDAFRHVSRICEIPGLQALQILPGAGKPSPLHYMGVLKEVQGKSKNLHITIPPEEVETALTELSARGLYILTRCETEEEARHLVENTTKWTRN